MNETVLRRALDAEIRRRETSIDVAPLDPERIANGHAPQLAVLRDHSRRQIWLCSRRAAKSVSVCAKMLHIALSHPNSIVIYFGATSKAVRLLIWSPVWQHFRRQWSVGGIDNETLMLTKFGNGSVVIFAGTDDYRHVETFLGGKLRAVFIDEAQSQPNSVLDPLLNRILPPALSDLDGMLVLSGTIPEVEAGLFYEVWANKQRYSSWSRHNWNRFQNPHIESEQALAKHLQDSGCSIDDALIQRDWFGRFVFAAELTAFRYDRAKAGYDGRYPSLDLYSVGVDPGTRDRTALVVWGWSQKEECVYHVYEWVTPRNSHTGLSSIVEQLQLVKSRWHNVPWMYFDMGGSQMALDTFVRDHGLPVIHAAKKTDRIMQVRRFSDLLATGKAKIRIGSALEEDLQRAQWDKDARAGGKYEWSSVWHPDVADAARYGLQGYFDCYAAPKPKEDYLTADARKEDERWQQHLQPPIDEGWKRDLDTLGYGPQSSDPMSYVDVMRGKII